MIRKRGESMLLRSALSAVVLLTACSLVSAGSSGPQSPPPRGQGSLNAVPEPLPTCRNCVPGRSASGRPALHRGNSSDVFFPRIVVTPMPNGLMPYFLVSALGGRGVPRLTSQMSHEVDAIRRQLRPRYRSALAVTFAEYAGREFLMVFLDGYWQYPELDCCHRQGSCKHYCACYLNPIGRYRQIRPGDLHGGNCADDLPIWNEVGGNKRSSRYPAHCS